MKQKGARLERGVAMLALLAVVALGASWFLVKQLNAQTDAIAAARAGRNAEVLNRAKHALVGYVAMQAAESGERNPGRLPCPEGVSYVGNSSSEGTAWGGIGTPCASVGRLPWRTLGLDKLLDSTSEPLWYVVGPTWRLTNSTDNLAINSDTAGGVSVDGQNAIALIIAPGPAMNAQAATGCTARNQSRNAPAPSMDARDYLECFDSATLQFTTTAASTARNDQVIRITAADLMPAIEAAIAQRIAREVAPVMQTVYAGSNWGLSGSARKYPFAASFADPSASAMQGVAANLSGLLPMTYAETFPGSGVLCTSGVSAPRCNPSFVAWSGGATMSGGETYNESCSTTTTQITCNFNYRVCILPILCGTTSSVPFTVNATAQNVGNALRRLSGSTTGTVNVTSMSSTAVLNASGSATISIDGSASVSSSSSGLLSQLLCGIVGFPLNIQFDCNAGSISIPITVFADHPLLDTRSTGGASTSWFARNKWHELMYYAVAAGYDPSGSAACTTGSSCLSVTNVTPAGAQRAILILAGRSIDGSPRPNPAATPGNYLEFGNATGAFERQPVSTAYVAALKKPFNDRVIAIDSN